MTKLEELKLIATAFCKKRGFEFLFANDYKFGFETQNGQMWTLTYEELADILRREI